MKLKVFSVFDSKAAYFGNPFYEQREASAVRAFSDAVNSNVEGNLWSKHPEDYSLFLLGEFDNETGSYDCCKPMNLVTASALKSAYNAPATVNGTQGELALS